MTEGKGGDAPLDGTIDLRSPTELGGLSAKCDPAERTEVNEGDEQTKTRIVLCSKGSTPTERAEGLQRARDRLAEDSQMKAEHRDRVLATLDKEIARIRSQQ